MPSRGFAVVRSMEAGHLFVADYGFPIQIHPRFTLNAEGRAVANDEDDFEAKLDRALTLSPTHEALLEALDA